MMAGMKIDSPPPKLNIALSPRERIVQKIDRLGILLDQTDPSPSCLVNLIKHDELSISDLVYSILPTDEDAADIQRLFKKEFGIGTRSAKLKELYTESLLWTQWMMFGCNPQDYLKDMAQKGERAVCGAVWGHNDLAYHCRTCEHDPTCAICVPCFQNGDHKDHDYSILYTGGGCCDCGDETAWNRLGFCSNHKGIRKLLPLPKELVSKLEPVIDILFAYWRDKLRVADELSSAVISMLLEFCNCSESLLSFISRRLFECCGLLDGLVSAERFLDTEVVKKLHELLLKLLGEPLFKYEFAKVLIEYYPSTVNEIIKECSDSMLEKYTLLSTFSVQIFTVPTLTLRLVREVDLLSMLLGCLTDLLLSCVGEDGRLQVNKWASVYETTLRLVEDTRYVISHDEVPIYIAQERPDILRAWLRILSLAQGMDPHKRETEVHSEDDNDNVPAPFALCYYLGNVHFPLTAGLYSVSETIETMGETIGQSSPCALDSALQYDDVSYDRVNCPTVRASAAWLIFECLKTIQSSFEMEFAPRHNLFSLKASSSNGSNILTLRNKLFRNGTSSNRSYGKLNQDNDQMNVSDNNDIIPEYSSALRQDGDEELNPGSKVEAFRIWNSLEWPTIEYDVSSQEISFHIPLHRLLSLLLRKALKTCGETGNFASSSSKQFDVLGKVLKGVSPSGFSAHMMEHPLRLRVFCAQVRAGMWRKNGDVAILSCEWYRSVRWLEIGLEPDLFLLQCCAALAPPDLFVKRIQERFGLINYTSVNLVDRNEYEPVLVKEMLTLIIQIVKERRFCGLSTVDNLRRELIYRLAIGDATHSQLVKALPRDLSKCDQLQNILDLIAVYSKPSGMKQGKYSLRKAFWKDLDLYHPRWNSRDLQAAEERYLRFCKISALQAQLPRWTAITEPMSTISRVGTSKSVLQIIRAVISYAVFTDTPSLSRAPDGVLITALHLLSLALDICETQLSCDERSYMVDLFPILACATEEINTGVSGDVYREHQSLLSLLVSLTRKRKEDNDYNYAETRQCSISYLIDNLLKKFSKLSPTCLDNLKRFAPDILFHSLNTKLDNLASASDTEERRKKAREHQAAILAKMRAEQSKFIASLESEAIGEPDVLSDQKEPAPICSLCRGSDSESPLCHFIHLQKSKLTSFVERGPISWDDVDRTDKEKRQITNKGALKRVKPSDDDTSIPIRLVQSSGLDFAYQDLFWESTDTQPCNAFYDSTASVTLEMLENDAYNSVIRQIYDAQFCANAVKGELNCSSYQVPLVASLLKKTLKRHHPLTDSFSDSTAPTTKYGPINCDGIHISSCGHAVHQECHDRYLASLKQRHLRRLAFEGRSIVDPDLGELLCPVCRRFANSLLPAVPSVVSNEAWMQTMPSTGSPKNNLNLPLALSLLVSTAQFAGQEKIQQYFSQKQNATVDPALDPALRKLYTLYSSQSYDDLSESRRLIQSLILWDTLTYSLVSTEIAARGNAKWSSLNSLYGELHSSSEFILSLLLRVAQTTRISSHQDVLLRFSGIQLIAGSICFDTSGDKKRGTLWSVLEHAAKGEGFPDILFCERLAEPVLSHDPFSSLMWTLFCLPYPFISSCALFIPLVHLFYCVCVVQALLTCYSSKKFDVSCFNASALNDICKMMRESEFVRNYFVSSYIELSCHPKDMIRKFTYPYLRRCALLWKMLQSSMSAPVYGGTLIWESNPYSKDCTMDCERTEELNGIRELEDLFQIQSLESVLENEVMHSLALKWCGHFHEEFTTPNYQSGLFCTPAVPFMLIQLPRLYQDLLQRYLKLECSSCKSVPDEPVLCLLCGKLCAPNWKTCCRASRCLNHATVCGAGVGVFLYVRRTTVFIQRSLRESSWPSPYLDAFGEEDHDMHRGRPLYLNEERYAALTYLVASHGLDQSSEVLRQTTISFNPSE